MSDGPAPATLRELTWRDIPALVRLEAQLFPTDAWDEATWWAELAARPRREYVVLEGAAGIVGYAGLDHTGDVADVMTVAVAPSHRGQGLGDRLVGELVHRAGPVDAVLLEVRADNEPARRLYARHDFEQISVRRRYYQPGDVDGIVMRRRVGEDQGDRDG